MDKRHLLSDQDDDPQFPGPGNPVFTGMPAPDLPQGGGASAPPGEMMHNVPGYEGTGSGEGKCVPPPNPGLASPGRGPSPSERQWEIPSIGEDFAKDAFIEYASSKCCYSSRPAKELLFTDLQAHNTYRYRLETFVESRKTEWDSVPYTGQVVDSYGSCVPAPWDIAVQVPAMFQNGKRAVQVPHTSSVKGCHNCLALGKSACQKCIASGWMQCWVCNGSGRRMSDNRCSHCNGVGRVRCTECSGSGSKTCHTCTGKGQLLFFINLIVEWKNHIYEFVPDKRSGFPVDRVSKVTGELLFTDTQYMVYPVVSFPDNAINQASQTAVREHQAQFVTTSRILQQRQTIELIPVTRVHYTWKEKTYIYFVYGAEHKVYTDDYPAKCCCCTII
ncbi:protein SSUH2 homolog isoform X1 [Acipenser ruthenus]|uniref:protein SSUH2 homolog isoform X1 n=1 Tax=Acipenser ruthenus TaxID=7906 RepID=UPI00145B64A0|nr:protein SSUH2 homolog isoform X1 [Acipenser ruthenus]